MLVVIATFPSALPCLNPDTVGSMTAIYLRLASHCLICLGAILNNISINLSFLASPSEFHLFRHPISHSESPNHLHLCPSWMMAVPPLTMNSPHRDCCQSVLVFIHRKDLPIPALFSNAVKSRSNPECLSTRCFVCDVSASA